MAEKKDLSALYEFDEAVGNEFPGGLICGTDEAGRGPLAGDVFAVVDPENRSAQVPECIAVHIHIITVG